MGLFDIFGGGGGGGDNGAGAIADATRESTAALREFYQKLREDLAPYRDYGQTALGEYAALYGIGRNGLIPQYASDVPESTGPTTRTIDVPAVAGRRGTGSIEDIMRATGASQSQARQYITGLAPLLDESVDPTGQHTRQYYYEMPGTPATTRTEDISGTGDSGVNISRSMEEARNRFTTTPGYQFRLEEGINALDRSASARGRLLGGGFTRELQRYGQGLATDEFENYANRLAGLAGMGQSSAAQTGTAGMQTASGISNALMQGALGQANAIQAGNANRASAFGGLGSLIGSLGGAYLLSGGSLFGGGAAAGGAGMMSVPLTGGGSEAAMLALV